MTKHGMLRWGPEALRAGFAQIPRSVLRDPDLPPGPKVVYAVLASYLWSGDEVAWPSQEQIAHDAGDISVRQVRRHLRDLEGRGLLSTEHRDGTTPLYSLWIPEERYRTDLSGPEEEPRTPMSAPPRTPMSADIEVVDVEAVDVEEGTTLSLQSPSATATPARQRPRLTEQQASMEEGLLLQGDQDADLILEVVECLTAGAKTARSRLNRIKETLAMREEYGREAWLYAMRKTAAKGRIHSLAYVQKIAREYDPQEAGTGWDGPVEARRLPVDRAAEYEAELVAEDAERERLAAAERAGSPEKDVLHSEGRASHPYAVDPSADTSYLQQEWPALRNAIWDLNIPTHLKQRWIRVLVNAVEGAGDRWVESEEQLVGLLAEFPPKASEETLPGKWLERVEKEVAPGSGAYAPPHAWVGDEFEKLGFTR